MRASSAPLRVLAARMREWLEEKGWTQQDLATRAGLSLATVSNLVRGAVTLPHAKTIKKVADAFGLTPYQLLHEQPATAPLPPDQQELVRLYARLSKSRQKALIVLLREGDAASKGSK